MPRRREEEVFDEYDARAYRYAHLADSSEAMSHYTKKPEKRKKSKQKSHKKSKDRTDKKRDREREDGNSTAVAVFGRTNIVDYEDVSSDSADLSDPLSGANSRVSGHAPPPSASSGKRAESPASAIRSYLKERSHSPSPVIQESSPYNRTERSSRKSKKRPRERSPVEVKTKYIEHSPPRTKQYINPPRAYAAEPPRAYAEVSSKYSGPFRNYSPPSAKKRYRSRSPTSPFGRRKSRSRSRYGSFKELETMLSEMGPQLKLLNVGG